MPVDEPWWVHWATKFQGIQTAIESLHQTYSDEPTSSWTTRGVTRYESLLSERNATLFEARERHQTDSLFFVTLKKRLQNQSSRLNRMPSEILLEIFSLVAQSPSSSPKTLAHVCHWWRTIVFGNHSSNLWSRIVLPTQSNPPQAISKLSTYLSLSRESPLTLKVRVSEWEPSLRLILLALLEPHLLRVRTLAIDLDGYGASLSDLSPLVTSPSLLDNLSITGSGQNLGEADQLITQPLPSLKRFALDVNDDEISSENITDVLNNVSEFACPTHLNFSYRVDNAEPYNLCSALGRFKDLVVLNITLSDWVELPDNEDGKVFSLPRLKHLTIQGHHGVMILQGLSSPQLQDLHILSDKPTASRTPVDPFPVIDSWFNPETLQFPNLRTATLPVPNSAYYFFPEMAPAFGRLEELELQLPMTRTRFNNKVYLDSFLDIKFEDLMLRWLKSEVKPVLKRLHVSVYANDVQYEFGHGRSAGEKLIPNLKAFLATQEALVAPGTKPIILTVDASLVFSSPALAAFVESEPRVGKSPALSYELSQEWRSYIGHYI